MTTQKRIRDAYNRQRKVYAKRPAAARGTSQTTVRMTAGLACEIEQGNWRFTSDQSENMGGDSLGPDPGLFGRAALGACAVQGYAIWFAKLGLPLETIEVRVESDIDQRGILAIDDSPAGYSAVRLVVTIESDAEDAAIAHALDEADRHSPWLYNFERALPVTREVTITRSRA